MTRARTGKGKKKNRWLEVTGSPRTEMVRAAPKAKLLMAGDELASHAGIFRGARREEIRAPLKTPAWEARDEYTTMLICFLMGGYYLMREVLLVFVLFRRLMVRRYTVISHSMHILWGTKRRKEWHFSSGDPCSSLALACFLKSHSHIG